MLLFTISFQPDWSLWEQDDSRRKGLVDGGTDPVIRGFELPAPSPTSGRDGD